MLKRIIGGIMLAFVGLLFLGSCSDNITLDFAKGIELGSSIAQVKELLGEPNDQLGNRTYEYYSDNILSIAKEIDENASKLEEIDGFGDLASLLAKEKELLEKLNQTEGKSLIIEFENEKVISVTFDAKTFYGKNDFASKTLKSYELIQGTLPQYSNTGSVSFESYFTDGSFFKGSSVAELKDPSEDTEMTDEEHEVVWNDKWGHSYTGTVKVGYNKDLLIGLGFYVLDSTIYLIDNHYNVTRDYVYTQWADKITDIVVKAGVTRLENRLPFKNAKNINLCAGIEYISQIAFKDTAYYNNIFNYDNGLLYLDDFLLNYTKTFTSTKNIRIKDNIKFIVEGTFSNQEHIKSIVLPANLTSIEPQTFLNCSNLTSITIPNSVTSIGDYAFSRCSSLTNITIPNSVTSIGVGAFRNCDNLTNITIPSSVTSIGDYTFSDCINLTSIVIPDSVKSIGSSAFEDCHNITSVTLGKSLNSIGNLAFHNCFHLVELFNLSSLSIQIGQEDYGGVGLYAKVIHTVVEESNLFVKGDYTFIKDLNNRYYLVKYNSNQKEIVLPKEVNGSSYEINDYAFAGSSIQKITIPTGVTAIGNEAFYTCYIVYMTLSEGLQEIGAKTFSYGSMASITIPSSVIKIHSNAFENCSVYGTIYFNGTKDEWDHFNVVITGNRNPYIIFNEQLEE